MLTLFLLAACATDPTEADKTHFVDVDQDGYGAGEASTDDCDDRNPDVHPDLTDGCDGIDQDCDGDVDEDAELVTYCPDADHDGYGDGTAQGASCAPPGGTVADCTDCGDTDFGANPAATEVCDGVDNDCDALVDAADPTISDATLWYPDLDADGYGAQDGAATSACDAPAASASNNRDCDDGASTVNPGVIEACNGFDEDCDPATTDTNRITADNGDTWTTWTTAMRSSEPGATLTFCPGTYTTTSNRLPHDLTLQSLSGDPADTSLSGGGGAAVVTVDGTSLTLSGMTVSGGDGTGAYWGGGINGYNATSLTIDQCVVHDNIAGGGGGVAGPNNGALAISDTEITSNGAQDAGGGLLAYGGALSAVAIHGNYSYGDESFLAGGGVAAFNAGDESVLVLDDASEVYENVAFGGGGLFVYGTASVSGGHWYANEAWLGAGVWAKEADVTLLGLTIDGNMAAHGADYGGAGLAFVYADARVEDCAVSGNDTDGYGGGAYVYESSMAATGGSFTTNRADFAGGAIVVSTNGALTLSDVDLGTGADDNTPDDLYFLTTGVSIRDLGAATSAECDAEGDCRF